MMRYAAIPWPWAGLFVAIALVGQETLLTRARHAIRRSRRPRYRMLVWTIGATSLALLLLPPRRPAYLLGFLVCAGLMGWALWLQYGLDLEPCPLCVFQRDRRDRDRRRLPDRRRSTIRVGSAPRSTPD